MATQQNPFDITSSPTPAPPPPGTPAAAPAPAPAPATTAAAPAAPQYTQEQMQNAIRQRRAEGYSDDQIADIGRNLGIGYNDFAQAMTAVDPRYKPNWTDTTGDWVRRATTLARVGFNTPGGTGAPANPPPGGVIASQTNLTPGTTAGYTPERMQTAKWDVDGNQLVRNQLGQVIAEDGLLMQQARTAALQGMGARGLINSSMAAGAVQDALVRTAMPIAQADAATYGDSAQFNASAENATRSANMNAGNRALEFGANALNTASQAAAGRDFERWKTEYSGNLQRWLADKDESTKLAITRLDGEIKQQLAGVEAQFKVQMQQSQSSAALYADTISSISRIMTDPNMDAGAKQNMINQLMASMQNGLRLQSAISRIPGLDDILGQIPMPNAPAPAPSPTAPGNRPGEGRNPIDDFSGG